MAVDLSDSLHGINYSGAAGRFMGTTVDTSAPLAAPLPTSFTGYCGELTQVFSFGVDYNDYTKVTGASDYGAQKAIDLSRLFTAFAGSVVDSATSAAMQAGIWEVIYEQGPSYDLTSGNFQLAPQSTTFMSAFNQVNGVLANLSSYSASYRIDVLQSPDHQDFVSGAIPEPGTWTMLAGGLAMLGFMAVRRRPRT